MRGEIAVIPSTKNGAKISISLGEIKKRPTKDSVRKASAQLLLRLAALSYVIHVITGSKAACDLNGLIFVGSERDVADSFGYLPKGEEVYQMIKKDAVGDFDISLDVKAVV